MECVEYEECVDTFVSSLFQAVVFTFLVIDLTTFRVQRDLGTCNKCHLSNGLYTRILSKTHCTLYENTKQLRGAHTQEESVSVSVSPLFLSDPRTLARQQILRATRKAPSLKTVQKSNKRQAHDASHSGLRMVVNHAR